MKRSDIVVLWNGLEAVKHLSGATCLNTQFTYAVAKTKRNLLDEVEIMRETVKAPVPAKAYNEARMALCVKHAKRDDKGEPVTFIDPVSKLPTYEIKDQAAFDAGLEALRTEHADDLARVEKETAKQKEDLALEVEVDIHQVQLEDVPPQITAGQMDGILDLVAPIAP